MCQTCAQYIKGIFFSYLCGHLRFFPFGWEGRLSCKTGRVEAFAAWASAMLPVGIGVSVIFIFVASLVIFDIVYREDSSSCVSVLLHLHVYAWVSARVLRIVQYIDVRVHGSLVSQWRLNQVWSDFLFICFCVCVICTHHVLRTLQSGTLSSTALSWNPLATSEGRSIGSKSCAHCFHFSSV